MEPIVAGKLLVFAVSVVAGFRASNARHRGDVAATVFFSTIWLAAILIVAFSGDL